MIGNLDRSLHRGLEQRPGALPVFVSPGLGDVAELVGRIERAHAFFVAHLEVEPRVAVLILDPSDWAARSNHPLYGMPNYRDGNLVLAGEPNPFWGGFVELAAAEVPGGRQLLEDAYPSDSGTPDLAPFFELLGIHELAHVFIEAAGRVPEKLWLLEYTCNLFMEAYVGGVEPDLRATLQTFPSVFARIAPDRFSHRTLEQFETAYAYGMDGANYGWFQSTFQVAAMHALAVAGPTAVRDTWDRLPSPASAELDREVRSQLLPIASALVPEAAARTSSA